MAFKQKLQDVLNSEAVLKAPGIYDGLSGLLVEKAGFDAAFLSGACISFARFGRPDMGLATASEVADTIVVIRDRVSIPLIVDMDTGFGNAVNVGRTVKTFERAGASALQMEDQLFPKCCGHMAGKNVISKDEMVGKIKAALDARENEDTMIIARTDALGVNGFEDAMDRARDYVEAGADALFIEAPRTIEQMKIIGDEFGSCLPLVHNLVEGGGTPVDGSDDMEKLGYKIALYPAALLHAFVPTAEEMLAHIKDAGHTKAKRDEMVDLGYMNKILGADDLIADAKKYGSD